MPNSILWIGLVVLWLFVLFPMLADRHPRIRQTTDVALSTRVLHRGGSKQETGRGPAAGHESDPNWRPTPRVARGDPIDVEDRMETDEAEPMPTDRDRFVPTRRGRGGFDPEADAIARAARYAFRQRMVLGLILSTVMLAALALIVSPKLWWLDALAIAGLVAYLCYLRRQVRVEAEIRRRRMARLGRLRPGDEAGTDEGRHVVPRRRGAVVLEADDEDPMFDHLPTYYPGGGKATTDLRDGREMRRAAGQ